jgi:hypothetical protein
VDGGETKALIERVGRIEKGYVVWRVAAVGSLLATAVLFVLTAARLREQPGTVTATEFVVVDGKGRPVMRLGRYGNSKGGVPGLEFLDGEGGRRIVMSVNEANVPAISLVDPGTGDQIVLDVEPQRGSSIAFRQGSSRSGLLLCTDKTGVTAIGFTDNDGNPVLQLGVRPDGSGRLALLSKEGEILFEIPGAITGKKGD